MIHFTFTTNIFNKEKCVNLSLELLNDRGREGGNRFDAAKALAHKIKQTVTFSIWMESTTLSSP